MPYPEDVGHLAAKAPLGEPILILDTDEEFDIATRNKGEAKYYWVRSQGDGYLDESDILCWWPLPKKPSELGREAARRNKQENDCPYGEADPRRALWRSGYYAELEEAASDGTLEAMVG